MLPTAPLDTGTVEVAGQSVAYRSLSRAEVVSLASMRDDPGAAEVFIIARSTGVTEDEATKWRDQVSAATAAVLLGAIATLSGLDQGNA